MAGPPWPSRLTLMGRHRRQFKGAAPPRPAALRPLDAFALFMCIRSGHDRRSRTEQRGACDPSEGLFQLLGGAHREAAFALQFHGPALESVFEDPE